VVFVKNRAKKSPHIGKFDFFQPIDYICFMSISTRTGDEGKTRILSGEKVPKYHPRVEAYGDLDELISFLGASRASFDNPQISQTLYNIQQDIFTLSAEIATDPKKARKLNKRISEESINTLDDLISKFEKEIGGLNAFITPGENLPSSFLDISRTIARRAERKIAKLIDDELVVNKNILIYLNRLSDLLFLLARAIEK